MTPARNGRMEPATDRRATIVAEAARLFDENGYANTSMEDLARVVGIAKPTLYHYFPGKDEILYEIHEAFIELLLAKHAQRRASESSPSRLLLGIMTDILELMETHKAHVRVFFEHHRELSPDRGAAMKAKRDEFQGMVTHLVRDAIEQGEFKDVDPELVGLAIFGMCNWSYQWYTPGGRWSAGQIARLYYDLLIGGVGRKAVLAADAS